jgi:chemotaxis methyl-accepting protein methylase
LAQIFFKMSRSITMSDTGYQERLDEDMQRLQRLLGEAVTPWVSSTPQAKKGEPVSILNLACGACDEAKTLADFFSQLRTPGQTPSATRLVGMDVREAELNEARQRFRTTEARAYEFLTGNAAKLDGIKSLSDPFDVLFFRHQNLYHGRTLWREIFDQGLNKLDDDGLVVITSYFDREHELALDAFRELGAEVLVSVENAHSRALSTPGKSVDRHLAVLRKKKA